MRSEGHALGYAEGKAEALAEGPAELPLYQLHLLFGSLPLTISRRTCAAALQDAHVWAMRLFDAKSLDDVFAPSA